MEKLKEHIAMNLIDTEKNENGSFDGMIIIWSKLNMSETKKKKEKY